MLYEKMTSWNNLLLAYQKAAKGKRGLPYVAAFEYALEENLLSLQRDLVTRTYSPGSYDNFYIHEPKKRLISAAPFRDRVVHHALCNIIEPVFEKSFIFDSYANRIGKGTHRALDRSQVFARRYKFVLQCDVRQFFPSIDHAVLMRTLEKKIHNADMMSLIAKILKSGRHLLDNEYDMIYFPGDDFFAIEKPRGLPIGNLTSQFWANVYLSSFDHFVKRELQCPGYVRYVDDILLFDNSKSKLWVYLSKLEKRLEQYRLTVHPNAQARPVSEGIPFLGFIIFPDKRRLKRRKGVYFQRKLNTMLQLVKAGEMEYEVFIQSVDGWLNHIRYANTTGLKKSILIKMQS